MVDGLGTTHYSYDAAGQLLTTSGPFSNDALTNTYSSRHRIALALQQPAGLWTNGFAWDTANRLVAVASPAGEFDYAYTALVSGFSGRLIDQINLPNSAYITNYFDPVARVLGALLKNSGGTTLDSALSGYNQANQRTAYTNAAGAYVLYSYDPIGQLTVASSSVTSENRGYRYDDAWNLNWLTNAGSASAFTVDVKNELTNWTEGPNSYDANGNMVSKAIDGAGDQASCAYDDENRLVDYQNPITARETAYVYDGLGRLRIRREYAGQPQSPLGPGNLTPGYNQVSETHYIYDGFRVVQERDGSNTPLLSYTRGPDLSGSLEGAGGIGGLLARSSGYSSGNWTSHAYYHADGNGNITCLLDTSQNVVASYRYDPYGNTLSQSGTLAGANTYRFSSKEIQTNSMMYYYGYRFYDPSLQRWLKRDPIGEEGFGLLTHVIAGDWNGEATLYTFVSNDPNSVIDAQGLTLYYQQRTVYRQHHCHQHRGLAARGLHRVSQPARTH